MNAPIVVFVFQENIHKLLQHQDSELTGELTADTLQNDPLQQSVMLGQYLNSMRSVLFMSCWIF